MVEINVSLNDFPQACLEQVIQSYDFDVVKTAFLDKNIKLDEFQLLSEYDYIIKEKEYFLGILKIDLSDLPLKSLLSSIDYTSSSNPLKGVGLFMSDSTLYFGCTNGTSLTTLSVSQDQFELVCTPIANKLTSEFLILPSDFFKLLSHFTTGGWEMQLQLSKTETTYLIKLSNSRSKQVLFFEVNRLLGTPPKYLTIIKMCKECLSCRVDIPLECLTGYLGLFENINTKETQNLFFEFDPANNVLYLGTDLMKVKLTDSVIATPIADLKASDYRTYLSKDAVYSIISQYPTSSILNFYFHSRNGNMSSLIIESKDTTHLIAVKSVSKNRV